MIAGEVTMMTGRLTLSYVQTRMNKITDGNNDGIV